jgi:hypothetical protein
MEDSRLRGQDGKLILASYYFGFESTGSEAVDRILAAVAYAGTQCHHTVGWEDDEPSEDLVTLIQSAANEAAKLVTKDPTP